MHELQSSYEKQKESQFKANRNKGCTEIMPHIIKYCSCPTIVKNVGRNIFKGVVSLLVTLLKRVINETFSGLAIRLGEA